MDFLLYLAIIPALGWSAQWIAWRTNLPGILLLLLFGVVLGQFVNPDDLLTELTGGNKSAGPQLLFPVVSLSVAVIMFEGGLSLQLRKLREAGNAAFRLCTIGALVTLAGATIAAHYCLGFEWRLSCLLGAILIVTGPTVIGPLLRQVRPSRRVAATLKWEGIVIDPIGAVLAVLVFEQLMVNVDKSSVPTAMLMLFETAAIGAVLGVLGGIVLTAALRKYMVPDNLQGVCALALALLLFAISNSTAHESGLITVTVLGIWLTNQPNFDIEHIIEFKENLRTLLIGCLFIVLGSRVDLAVVAAIGVPGFVFLVLLIVLVRPISVFISLWKSPLDLRERAFIAGLAPRGIVAAAVSSVFALEMERRAATLEIPGSDQLATVTFFVIIGTVAVYGVAASPLARWLGLAVEKSDGVLIAGADGWVRDFARELSQAGIPVILVDTNYNKIAKGRVEGIEAVCANILNEYARDELPLSGIGQMMAMTPNDEVNSLAIRECRSLFERAHLYQLSFNTENQHFRRGLTQNLMGRELFAKGLTFSRIQEMHEGGERFKTTKLSDEFTFDDYVKRYHDGLTLLCVLSDDESLAVNTVDNPLIPIPGQTIIALIASTAANDSPEADPSTDGETA